MKKILAFLPVMLLVLAAANGQIVINEIMYNPPESGTDSLEYIEIYNTSNAQVDISGWSFTGVDLVFAPGTTIGAKAYILTAGRPSAIQAIFGKPATAWTGGALTNTGEFILLRNGTGAVVDSVQYDDAAPWPTDAAGNGRSLELCDASLDNALAANWKAANHNTGATINSKIVYGTPGEANTSNCLPNANHYVNVQNNFFSPADITINQGESVLWYNQQGTHNVNGSKATFPANPVGFSSGALAPATWIFADTFDVAGVYNYRCDAHFSAGMVGKITVLPKAISKIVITEFNYNDPGVDSLEYIEIFNNGTAKEDLSGWTFSQGVAFTFPAGASLDAGKYAVIAKYPAYFKSKFGFDPNWNWPSTEALTNTGEDIELRNAANEVMDYLDYKNAAPWPDAANGQGPTAVLCDPNSDNGNPVNWQAATTDAGFAINGKQVYANPGGASGCPTGVVANDDAASVGAGSSVTINVLANDFSPNPGANVVTISFSPAHGTATVNANNSITFTPKAGYCGPDELLYTLSDGVTNDIGTVSIAVRCYPKRTIAEITTENATSGVADSVGVYCEVEDVVYGVNIRPQGYRFTIIDGQNHGIHIFRDLGSFGYTVKQGDRVAVRGHVEQFNGLTQMAADTIWKISADNPLINPTVVVTHSESTESSLIKIKNLVLTNPALWTTGSGTSGFTALAVSPDHATDTVAIRVDNDCPLYDSLPPAFPFNMRAIGGQFDLTSPFTSGYQAFPCFASDIELILGTQEADFSGQVQLLPNPAHEFLTVKMEVAFDQIQLFSTLGQRVLTLREPDLEAVLDLRNVAPGTYFLRFEKDGVSWMTRVIRL